MTLNLDMCDVGFRLAIRNWKETGINDESSLTEWADVNFSLKGKYIDYSFVGETLLCSEVVFLRNRLEALLDGREANERILSFAEPDFEFRLFPAGPGGEPDVSMKMVVHFWYDEGGLGTNAFSMDFDRQKITALYIYLLLVTGKLEESDPHIEWTGAIIPD